MEAVVAAAHGAGNDEEHTFIVIQRTAQTAQDSGVSNIKAAPKRTAVTSGVKTRATAG